MAKRPGGPLALSKFANLLRNRYYLGVVPYRGVEHPGKHPALIGTELFERVQLVLDERDQHSIKTRRHQHYLRGLLNCARCGARLQYTTGRGRHGGEFDYYICSGRHRGQGCELPYLAASEVEKRIEQAWPLWVKLDELDGRLRSGSSCTACSSVSKIMAHGSHGRSAPSPGLIPNDGSSCRWHTPKPSHLTYSRASKTGLPRSANRPSAKLLRQTLPGKTSWRSTTRHATSCSAARRCTPRVGQRFGGWRPGLRLDHRGRRRRGAGDASQSLAGDPRRSRVRPNGRQPRRKLPGQRTRDASEGLKDEPRPHF